jgi:KDO2-lipid IV(A) lauroyltransferase
MGMAFSALGHPLISVAAPIENPRIDELFNRLRSLTGQQVVSKHGAMRRLLRTLHDGGKIALLLDQNTKPADGGRFVPFFGLPVLVSNAAAALWRRTGAEVYVVMSMPGENGHYLSPSLQHIAPPQEDDPQQAELEMTRRITAAIELAIRREPAHWLWMYKRWKYVAPGLPREQYPYYAKAVKPA